MQRLIIKTIVIIYSITLRIFISCEMQNLKKKMFDILLELGYLPIVYI